MLNIRMNKEKRMWKFKIIFHRRHINNFVSAVDSWQQFLASVTMVSKHQEALLYYQMMKIILSFMTRKLLYILDMLYKREKLILFHQEDILRGICIKGVENREGWRNLKRVSFMQCSVSSSSNYEAIKIYFWKICLELLFFMIVVVCL